MPLADVGRSTWVELINSGLLHPRVQPFNEPEHSIAGIPFRLRCLIEAEYPSPLNVRPRSPSLMRNEHIGVAERKLRWD